MKNILSVAILALVLLLGACGSDTDSTEKEVASVNSEQKGETTEKVDTEKNDDSQKKEFNELIADTDNVKVTLLGVEKVVDKEWDEEKFLVKFEVENKRQDTIEVQANEVSADGKMIDEMMLMMSTEVSAGKKADAVLTIENYEGDLPALEDNLEMILHIFSWDNDEFTEDHQVTIDLK